MARESWILAGLLFGVLFGCSDPNRPLARTGHLAAHDDRTVRQVCRITAEMLGVNPAEVTASTSLGDLAADELDIVELVMELEDHFNVSIPDDAITGVTGRDQWQQGAHRLTMAKLAQIVDEQKR